MTNERRRLLEPLGHRVRALRAARGWTVRDLATRAGISPRFLSQLEGGEGNISVARLADLAHALGTNPAAMLVGVAKEPHETPPLIALLGVRGAGKSTIGRRLAEVEGVPFYEIDALIERGAGLSLGEIFAVHGERYFRQREREALLQLLDQHDGEAAVLATGGGVVTDARTYRLLRARCTTVWLRASADDHWNRVVAQGDQRPMSDNPRAKAELRELLAERAALYAQADLVIDTSALGVDGSVEAVRSSLDGGGRTGPA